MGDVISLNHRVARDRERIADLLIKLACRVRDGVTDAVGIVEVRESRTVVTWTCDAAQSYHGLNSGAARLASRLASEPPDDIGGQ